jgi:lantibiotic biosynthesis protein
MTTPTNTRDVAFLGAADRIACRLCRDALWAGDQCNWLGWAMTPIGGSWSLACRALPPSLYDGTAGIALFLGRVFEITRDPTLKETALGALNRSIRGAGSFPESMKSALYAGLAGVAYTCVALGRIFEDERIVRRGLAWLDDLRGVPPSDGNFDVCVGSAGTIQALLDIDRRQGHQDLVETALAHGDHLLQMADRSEQGWSWATMPGTSRNLLGYAHGAAGIATALLELWAATGEDKYRAAALSAIQYERLHFDRSCSNWPDFRTVDPSTSPPTPAYMMAWCHGAPGIGLSRVRAHQLLKDDPQIGEEIQSALQATVNHLAVTQAGGHGNYCLCHGSGGNAELFIIASEVFGRPDLLQVAETVARNAIVLHHESARPWPCGVSEGVETPNLMLGLAGIGYFFLRLYDPVGVPSVLLITLPRVHA